MMDCQAIILNAGKGSRLRPLTNDVHKSLLPIGNENILERQAIALRDAGVNRIVMVTGYRADQLEAAAQCIDGIEWKFVRNKLYDSTENIYSFYLVEEELSANTIVMMGDIVCESHIFKQLLNSGHEAAVAVRKRQTYTADDMKIRQDKGVLTEICKTITEPDAEYLQITYYSKKFSAAIVDAVRAMRQSEEVSTWYPAVLQHVINKGESVVPVCVEGKWHEIDTAEDLKGARNMFEVLS